MSDEFETVSLFADNQTSRSEKLAPLEQSGVTHRFELALLVIFC
ncbi:hypothetical protein [Hyphomonas atlantica corrig.]|nr:hypothetical protein [Hyphomonas atlantica]